MKKNKIIKVVPAGPLQVREPISLKELIHDWLGDKSPETMRSYKDSLDAFRRFCGKESESEAIEELLALPHGEANMKALQFKNWMRAEGRVSGGINTRLSALRSIVALANLVGRVPWVLAVKNEKSQVYKDTRGPGAAGFDKLIEAAKNQKKPQKVARDLAILWLLYGQALRRNGVASLDLEHVDEKQSKIYVLLKGHRERNAFTLSPQVMDSLSHWLDLRGRAPGPVFPNCDPAHKGSSGRITGNGIWNIVKHLGEKCGLVVWPHALRHAGTTTALDVTGGDLRAVQRFTGHKDVRVLSIYDDNREDMGLAVAKKIAQHHKQKEPEKP